MNQEPPENQENFLRLDEFQFYITHKKPVKKMEIGHKKGTKQNCLVPVSPQARMNQEPPESA